MMGRVFRGLALAAVAMGAGAQTPTMTLEQALRRAEEVHPSIRTAQAQLASGDAELREARALLWNNPNVSADLTRRRVPEPGLGNQRFSEWTFGLSQAFETGGQAGYRRDAAAASREALALLIPDARRRLAAEVRQRFYRVLSSQQRVALEIEGQRIADDVAELARKRVRAGEDSRLDGNLARIEAERVRNQAGAARSALLEARAELAALLSMPLEALPEVSGELQAPASTRADDLAERVAERSDLRAARFRVEAARRRVDLERAARSPDVTLGIAGGRESFPEARETFTTFSIALPLPIFRRNDAAIGRALAELTQAETEYRAALAAVRAEVAGLVQRQAVLAERVRRLRAEVIPTLDENLQLSRRAREAGEIGVTQLLLVSRQVIDARRELLEAQTELRTVESLLDAAVSQPQSND